MPLMRQTKNNIREKASATPIDASAGPFKRCVSLELTACHAKGSSNRIGAKTLASLLPTPTPRKMEKTPCSAWRRATTAVNEMRHTTAAVDMPEAVGTCETEPATNIRLSRQSP